MKLINLTPHALTVFDADNNPITFPKCDNPARVTVSSEVVYALGSIEVSTAIYGDVYNLPESKPDTYYIVSMLVRQALPERTDLLSPGELVRDEGGNAIGCRGLTCNK
jgi:hypothetical protein